MPNNNDNNNETKYRCVTCGAVIPERPDGFLECVCSGCGGTGFVNEADYTRLWEKPVTSPPRPHTGKIEAYPVKDGEMMKFVGELSGEWIRGTETVNLGDSA